MLNSTLNKNIYEIKNLLNSNSLINFAFALIPAGIPTTFENVLAQQDGNSSNDTNMSSLEEDR